MDKKFVRLFAQLSVLAFVLWIVHRAVGGEKQEHGKQVPAPRFGPDIDGMGRSGVWAVSPVVAPMAQPYSVQPNIAMAGGL